MKTNESTFLYPDKSSELRFRLLAEAAFEGIIIHNGQQILDVNEQACELFKYSRTELLDLPLKALIDFRYHDRLDKKIRNDVSSAYMVVALKQTGEAFTADVRGKSLYTATGKIRIVAVKDNTKQQEYEQRLGLQYRLSLLFQSEKKERTAIRRFLGMLCTAYLFEIGEFYYADPVKKQMFLYGSWYQRSHSELKEFVKKSRNMVFPYGIGFPGIVAETGELLWTSDIPDSPFVRTSFLTQTRIKTATCIPFSMYGSFAGCYLLFSRQAGIPPINHTYSTISSQLGQYLEASKSGEQLLLANNAVRTIPSQVYVADRHGHVLWSNQGSKRIFCSPERSPSGSGLPAPIYKVLKKGIIHLREGNGLYREELQCLSSGHTAGRVREVIITPQDSSLPVREQRFTLTVSDITEQKKLGDLLNQYSSQLEEQIRTKENELTAAYKEIFRQHKLEQDLAFAGDIQRSLLPQHPPAIRGWDVAAKAIPASSTGGDLYDFIRYTDTVYYIVMADISGKGIGAALLTSAAKAIVREKIRKGNDPGTVISLVNASLYEDLSRIEMFITLLVMKIDIDRHMLTYANAGHTSSIVFRNAETKPDLLIPTGIPVGILPELEITTGTCVYAPGYSIVVYSDGFTEALDESQKLYRGDRFISLVRKTCAISAHKQVTAIFDAITAYRGTEQQSDDCTLVVLKSVFTESKMVLQPSPAEADRLLTAVEPLLKAYAPQFFSDVSLIVMELFTNILTHSMGVDMETGTSDKPVYPITFVIRFQKKGIVLDFRNKGLFFDQSKYHAPVLGGEQVNGYGLFLVRQLADVLEYSHTETENHWHLEKKFREAVHA